MAIIGRAFRFGVFDSRGKLRFGGTRYDRQYIASCHSLYALYVEAHGVV